MSASVPTGPVLALAERFRTVRRRTLELVEGLTPEDMMVQSCPEASPAKWHLAHTSWFFESFILREFLAGYRVFHPDFAWLFNSYYQTFTAFPEKRLRASFSRPSLEQILRYRAHVDAAVEQLFENGGEPRSLRTGPHPGGGQPEALRRIELGANHEEQHQELLLTDILHAFFTNPLKPAYLGTGIEDPGSANKGQRGEGAEGTGNRGQGIKGSRGQGNRSPLRFNQFPGGLHEVGNPGEGFCFDNELPQHRVWLEPYALANQLVTCGEYAEFIADSSYRRPELWLSAGWDAVKQNRWEAPLYWTHRDGEWNIFTLRGELRLSQIADVPVSQVSYFEADAYARWAGCRLPTEFEWEAAAEQEPVDGNLLDSGNLMPMPTVATKLLENEDRAKCIWGDCWEWTASAYLGYPGFKPLEGSLGEYNGKFMSGQMVLRGGSCVTPAAHIRATYRNFFAPETRWQFSGIRLAQSQDGKS